MKKILFLMLIMSVSLFANWEVQRNKAYVKSEDCIFTYYTEGESFIPNYIIEIPMDKDTQEGLLAYKDYMILYIADSKNPNYGVGIESARKGNWDDFYNLVNWRTTEKGIEGLLLESSPHFEEVNRILKNGKSFILGVYFEDVINDNLEKLFETSLSSIGYIKAKATVDKNTK